MRKDKVISEVLGHESALSPSDMYTRRFRRALVGGYSPRAVKEFLARVADVLETLIHEVRDLKERSEQQRALLEEYRAMEATLRSALLSSQKMGEDIVESARREAQAVLGEAKAQRAHTHLEAAKLPVQLSRDIDALDQQRQRFRQDMVAILATHRNLLDSLVPEQRMPRSSGFFEAGSVRAPNDERADETPDAATGSEEMDESASKAGGDEVAPANDELVDGIVLDTGEEGVSI